MRILCLANLFPNPLRRGKGIFNFRQLALMAKRTPLRVISPVPWTDAVRARMDSTTISFRREWGDWEGVNVAYCRSFYTPGILRAYYGSFLVASLQKTFRWAVDDFQPDLIYASWAYPDGWAACRLAKEFDLPVAVKVHGSDLLVLDEYPGRKKRTIEMLSQPDCIFAVGNNLRERAIQLGAPAGKTHVIREGTDRELFSPGDRIAARRHLGLPTEGQRVVFVGNLVPVKGVSHLVDACHRLDQAGFPFQADLLGEGPLKDSLGRQIAEFGLEERVRLVGWQPPSQLPYWYRAADLVVLPSFSEGIPNVLVEAASCGTPFVATDVGGIPEIAHLSPGRLVPPGDGRALAREIHRMLTLAGQTAPGGTVPHIPTVNDAVTAKMDQFANVLAARRVMRPVASVLSELAATRPAAGGKVVPLAGTLFESRTAP